MISEYKMSNTGLVYERIINYSHTIILCDRLHGHSITGIHISRIITSLLVTNIVPGNICLHHWHWTVPDRLLTRKKQGGAGQA